MYIKKYCVVNKDLGDEELVDKMLRVDPDLVVSVFDDEEEVKEFIDDSPTFRTVVLDIYVKKV